MRVGIINSGGDVQGINAVIASAVKVGQSKNMQFLGFIKGWEGLLDKDYIILDAERVRGISHEGGTILHSVNKGRFAGKVGEGEMNRIPEDILQLAIKNLQELEVDALIVIGGDGTLSGAIQLVEKGIKLVGVPKTIDNDLNSTDQTFGFSTAVEVAVEALDRVHTTAYSHNRVMFFETMGRHAGWIALNAGVAGGAHAILLPEYPFSYKDLGNMLRERNEHNRNYSIVVVAEGAHAKDEELNVISGQNNQPEVKLGGITNTIMAKLEELFPGEFEMRNVVLGHIQRGGTPNAEDRILAKTYGASAVEAIAQGEFGKVVCLVNREIKFLPIADTVDQLKQVEDSAMVFKTAQSLGIYMGKN